MDHINLLINGIHLLPVAFSVINCLFDYYLHPSVIHCIQVAHGINLLIHGINLFINDTHLFITCISWLINGLIVIGNLWHDCYRLFVARLLLATQPASQPVMPAMPFRTCESWFAI